MARDARIELVISALDNASKVLAGVTKEMDDLTNKTSEASKSAKLSESSFSGAATALAAMTTAALAAGAAIAALGFKEAIAAAEKFELTTINIASQLTNMAAEGQGSYKEMFDKNQIYAKAFYEKLRQYDAERASSIEEMMVVYNALVTQGYQVRMEEAKSLSMITDLIKQKTAGQGFEIQAFQEIRALMDGQANMHSRIAMELKERIGPAWAEILKQHEKAGTLLTYLNSLYPGIEASSEKMQQTLEAQTTTLKSQLTYIGREGLAKAYEDVVEWLAKINEYLKTHADELIVKLQKGWDSIRMTLAAIPDLIIAAIDKTAQWIEKIGVLLKNPVFQFIAGAATGATLAAPVALLGGGPAALGVGAVTGGLGAIGLGAYSQYKEIDYAAKEFADKLNKKYGGLEGGYGPSILDQSNKTGRYITIDSLKKAGVQVDLNELTKGLPEQTKGKIKDDFAEAIKEGTKKGYKQAASIIAKQRGLDPEIFSKMIERESGWDRYAEGPVTKTGEKAKGLGQLMPGTAASLGVKDVFDAGENLKGAATYLKQMLEKFGGRYDLALAAYNAGPGAVDKYKGIPPYRETQKYVWSILGTGGSRAAEGQKEIWKQQDEAARESERAATQAEKDRQKRWQDRLKWTNQLLGEEIRAVDRTEKEEQKLHVDTIRYNKRRSEEYLQSELRVNEVILAASTKSLDKIMAASTLTYQERTAAVDAYREASIKSIDLEIEKLRTLGISEQALESYRKAQLESVNDKIRQATESSAIDWESAWKRAAENVQDTLANFIENLITNSRSGADILKNILSSATRMMSQMAAQALMNIAKVAMESMSMGSGGKSGLGGILSGIAGFAGKIFGGMFGGGSAASTTSWTTGGAANPSNFSSWTSSYATFGDGAVFPRGFTPIGQYGDGAVFASPTLGIIGERYEPEAVVPLDRYDIAKKGENTGLGGQGQGGDIQIINVFDQATIQSLALQAFNSEAGRRIILNAVTEDMIGRGMTMKTMRRR